MLNLKNELILLENNAKKAKQERRKAENKGDAVAAAYHLGRETVYETLALDLKKIINDIPFDL